MFVKASGQINPWTTYIKPFSSTLWLTLFLLILGSAILFFFIEKVSKYNGLLQIDDSFSRMVVIHGFLGQGTAFPPGDISKRIAFFSVFLAGYLVIATYSGVLTSFLTIIEQSLPFHDKKSLLDNSDFSVTALPETLNENYFKVNIAVISFGKLSSYLYFDIRKVMH